MVILDTNIILRYLLNDNNQMADEAEKIIRENAALVTIEIIAEVVYVLKRVDSIERGIIKSSEYLKFIERQTVLCKNNRVFFMHTGRKGNMAANATPLWSECASRRTLFY